MVRLSSAGAGAVLGKGDTSVNRLLGPDGKTTLGPLRANPIAGEFQIVATATFAGETARYSLNLTNNPPPFLARHRKKLIAAGVACAATAISVLALHKTPPPSVTISSSGSAGPVGHP